jgi:hypothetical protein
MLSMSYMYDWQVGDEDVGIIMSHLITIASLIVIRNSLLVVASLCSIFHLALICVVMSMSRNDRHNSLNMEVVFFQGTPAETALGMSALTPLTVDHSMVNDELRH